MDIHSVECIICTIYYIIAFGLYSCLVLVVSIIFMPPSVLNGIKTQIMNNGKKMRNWKLLS